MKVRIGDHEFLRLPSIDWMLHGEKCHLADFLCGRLGTHIKVMATEVALFETMIEIDDKDWTMLLLKRAY